MRRSKPPVSGFNRSATHLIFRAVLGCTLLLLFACGTILEGEAPHPQRGAAPTPPPLLLGAAWYPEQWPESRWEKDLELMQKAHVHLVRIGEYTWSRDEPTEGHYDLDWLVRAIDMAGRHGIFVVMGTPSNEPPQWLIQKYPEVLRTLPSGRQMTSDGRSNYNWSSPKYRELVREIDEKIAQRIGHNPYVIAWQIDNEYNFPSYDAETRAQFQGWLEAKYKTLKNLNVRLNGEYWSKTYSSWSQIPIPLEGGNPGLRLDWMRFVTDTWRSYQKNQIDAIRKYADPRQRITTNMMGWFDGMNYSLLAQDLDFAADDDPLGHWANPFRPTRNAMTNDLVRGFKNQNYWIMETTAGSNMAKGEMRAGMWQDIGHGADTTCYWQWRDGLNGQEQNHKGVLVGVDGTPTPEYSEISQVGEEYEKAEPALAGTRVESQVALLQSYPSRWTLNWQRENPHYDPISLVMSYYAPLHRLGQSVDIVSPYASLARYKLVVAPGLNVVPRKVADRLIDYVRQGGHLVLGQRSGMKDWDNSRWPQRQPGPLAELLGGRVEQYFALRDSVPVSGVWGTGTDQLYAERLGSLAGDVKVLMRYGHSNGWLDGNPAAITRTVGRGTITYIGIWMNPEAMEKATKWMLAQSGIKADLPIVPAGVEIERRVAPGREVLLIENFAGALETVSLPARMRNVLTGASASSVTLPVYGVAIFSRHQ